MPPHRRRPLTRAEQKTLTEYETWMLSWRASKATVSARLTFTAARLREWGLDGFTTEAATNYMADLVRHERSDWTISTYHTHLTTFSEWLVSSGRLDHDPMADVRVPERPKSEPNPLSDADLNRVLAAATGITRDWILLALHAGLRAHEIAKLRGEHVQVEGIRVTGKGRKVVTLPCHPVIWDMAQRYPRSGYWFPAADGGHIPMPQVSGGVGTFFTGLGLEGGIHRVRHSYCTRLLRAGVHIRKVQKLMRHANLATTAGYAAVDEDELRDAILMLPPLPA